MTQEERRQRREQDTKNAMVVLIGLICILAAIIIGVVLIASVFFKKDEVPADTSNTTVVTEAQTEEETEAETQAPESVVDEATRQAIAVVSGMTLEQKVAQLFVITPDALANVNGATVFGNTSKRAYAEYPVGGIIYTTKNLKGKEQTAEMASKMKEYAKEVTGLPVFIGIEEEGGSVVKIASIAGFGATKVDKMSVMKRVRQSEAICMI